MAKRVLISGASIAGPALAFWLSRDGFEVTVVERASSLRSGGYAVDFRGTATRVLERMGLVDAVKRQETRTGSIIMVDANGKMAARLPDGFTSGDLEILRGDLSRVLYEATRHGADYIFGDSIQEIRENSEHVDVAFASGKTATFDFVIGADGLHSNVRSLAFGKESEFVHPMGYYIAVFTLPDILGLGNAAQYYAELGKRVGYFGTPNDGRAKATFYWASNAMDYDRRDISVQKALLREIFANVGWQAGRLLEYLEDSPDFYFDSLSQVRMKSWSKGRFCLLGDSAACPTPMAGMGTSVAIVGAYVLAGELNATPDDYTAAFARYEASLRPFVDEAQKMAEGVSWFIPQTRIKLWFSKKMWSLMPQSTMRKLMIEQPTQVASMVQMKEYR